MYLCALIRSEALIQWVWKRIACDTAGRVLSPDDRPSGCYMKDGRWLSLAGQPTSIMDVPSGLIWLWPFQGPYRSVVCSCRVGVIRPCLGSVVCVRIYVECEFCRRTEGVSNYSENKSWVWYHIQRDESCPGEVHFSCFTNQVHLGLGKCDMSKSVISSLWQTIYIYLLRWVVCTVDSVRPEYNFPQSCSLILTLCTWYKVSAVFKPLTPFSKLPLENLTFA